MWVEVGLLGLQTTTTWVAAVISSASHPGRAHRRRSAALGSLALPRAEPCRGKSRTRAMRRGPRRRPRRGPARRRAGARSSRWRQRSRRGRRRGARQSGGGEASRPDRDSGSSRPRHARSQQRRRGAVPTATRSRRAGRCPRRRSPRAPCRRERRPCSRESGPGVGGANRHCAECRSARSFFVSPR